MKRCLYCTDPVPPGRRICEGCRQEVARTQPKRYCPRCKAVVCACHKPKLEPKQ